MVAAKVEVIADLPGMERGAQLWVDAALAHRARWLLKLTTVSEAELERLRRRTVNDFLWLAGGLRQPSAHEAHVLLTIGGIVLAAVAGLAVWLITSVARGAKARDEGLRKQLAPVAEKLEKKASISAGEIQQLARSPQLRSMLYALLSRHGRLDLFPSEYLSKRAQAESALTYWMMHPNELRAPPARIELLDTLRRIVGGKEGEFFVFRYQMPEGHWAGPDWVLGLAGPFRPDEPPYGGAAAGFSRADDVAGKVSPTEVVDRYVALLARKVPA